MACSQASFWSLLKYQREHPDKITPLQTLVFSPHFPTLYSFFSISIRHTIYSFHCFLSAPIKCMFLKVRNSVLLPAYSVCRHSMNIFKFMNKNSTFEDMHKKVPCNSDVREIRNEGGLWAEHWCMECKEYSKEIELTPWSTYKVR